jgi:hypothetical protein
MKRLLWMLAVTGATAAVAGPAWAQTNPGTVRMSWNSCDVIDDTEDLTGVLGSLPKVVISGTGLDIPMVGIDVSLFLGPNLPDAWRFDDVGCQTGTQLVISRTAFNKTTCPLLRGTNPGINTIYGYDPASGRAQLRVVDTHDTFVPSIGIRYTWLQLTFDHTFSVDGPPPTCAGIDQPVCIAFGAGNDAPQVLGADGGKYFPTVENTHVNWISMVPGCPGVVPTQPSTWGRVKGLYR